MDERKITQLETKLIKSKALLIEVSKGVQDENDRVHTFESNLKNVIFGVDYLIDYLREYYK